jgi:5-methylthioadenosine/S-adenosylhomocysteine deaminase
LYAAVARYAAQERLPVAVHIAESAEESLFVAQGSGPFADGWRARGIPPAPRAPSPVALLRATGILDTRPLLVHCVHLTSDDIADIARSGAAVVHCPASNAKLRHGIAPVTQLLGGAVPVGLGTDSVASNNRMDILDEARLAVLMSRAAQRVGIDADAALELATVGGAAALGLRPEIGSLETGKAADLAAFRVDWARDEPVYDPATALLFGSAGRRALLVVVQGVELVRDGRLLTSLEADIAAVREGGRRLARFAVEAPAQGR